MRRGCENIVNAVRDVVKGELVHREVPEFIGRGRESSGFLGILVPTIISQLSSSSEFALDVSDVSEQDFDIPRRRSPARLT